MASRKRSRDGDAGPTRSGEVAQSSHSSRERRKARRFADEKERDRAVLKQEEYDDKDGHYIIKIGETLGYDHRYRIKKLLGEGTFGKVVECQDRDHPERTTKLAIKVIKSIEKYRDAAFIELEILKSLKAKDPKQEKHFVRLHDYFDYHRHICMVFPLLGLSLYDFMKSAEFAPFSLEVVRSFAYQLLKCIEFCHSQHLTHTDLKPENILLEDDSFHTVTGEDGSTVRVLDHSRIQVIDFGSATWRDDHHTAIVSTRHYRAPEVILGLGWESPCDLWSIGCILAELYCGETLFQPQTHDNLEHLAMMEKILGPVPVSMLRASRPHSSSKNHRYCDDDDRLRWPEKSTSRSSQRDVAACKPLRELQRLPSAEHRLFFDLLTLMLIYQPEIRTTATAALAHPFFTGVPESVLLDIADR